MFELIHKLHTVFNMMKGFRAGYTSQNHSQMMVSYDNKVYKVTFEEVRSGQLESSDLSHIRKADPVTL